MLNDECFFTGMDKDRCICHHCFGGTANRKLSEIYGMKVWLVPEYHTSYPNGVHRNRRNDLRCKRYAQSKFEETHSREEFISVFGKSYL